MKFFTLLVSALVGLATAPPPRFTIPGINNNQAGYVQLPGGIGPGPPYPGGGAGFLGVPPRVVPPQQIPVLKKYKLGPMSKMFLYGSACYLYRYCSKLVFGVNYVPDNFSYNEYEQMLGCQYDKIGLMNHGLIVGPKRGWSMFRIAFNGLYQRAKVIFDRCYHERNNALTYAKCALQVAEDESFAAPVSQFMIKIPDIYLDPNERFFLKKQAAGPL